MIGAYSLCSHLFRQWQGNAVVSIFIPYGGRKKEDLIVLQMLLIKKPLFCLRHQIRQMLYF
jgi:hypothetical protein